MIEHGRAPEPLVAFVSERLQAVANPDKVAAMTAYMKGHGTFLGVVAPDRKAVLREAKQRFKPTSVSESIADTEALWRQGIREFQYFAIEWANSYKRLITLAGLPLYERMIREGAWWDVVDGLAGGVISRLNLTERETMRPLMDRWIEDPDMWIRRTAILGQLKHKAETDPEQLFDYCSRRMHEREFFIRKAIGWALREYSYSAPEAVQRFLTDNKSELSGLSFREAARVLRRNGVDV